MNELLSQNQALATLKLPNQTWNNRMSANDLARRVSRSIRRTSPLDTALSPGPRPAASLQALDRHTPTQSLQTLSIGPCRARAIFSSESVIIPDLDPSRSRATEFSWTSRSQNRKLVYLNSIEEAFHSNLTTELRDIHENVKIFLEKAPRMFSTAWCAR